MVSWVLGREEWPVHVVRSDFHLSLPYPPQLERNVQFMLLGLIFTCLFRFPQLEDAKRHAKRVGKKSEHVPRPSSAMGRLQTNHRHPHPHGGAGNVRPKSSTRSDQDRRYQDLVPPSLNMLKDMRKLQSTLRRDDLCWE